MPDDPRFAAAQQIWASLPRDEGISPRSQFAQDIWNQAAADQWTARVNGNSLPAVTDNRGVNQVLSTVPDAGDQAHQAREWTNRQFAGDVGYGQAGNEFHVGNRVLGPDIAGDASRLGLTRDQYIPFLIDQERRKKIDALKGRSRFDVFSSNPAFGEMAAPQVQALYQSAYGYSPSDEVKMNRADMDQRMQQAAFMSAQMQARQRSLEQTLGYSPGEAALYYDPKTGPKTETSTIPMRDKVDEFGRTITSPPRVVRMPRAIYDQAVHDLHEMTGWSPQEPPAAKPDPMPHKPQSVRQNGVVYHLQPDGSYK